MIDLATVKTELAELHYWPNFRFSAVQHLFRGIVIRVCFDVLDSNDHTKMITIGNDHNVPTIARRSIKDFHEWLLDELIHKGIHEVVEAYRPHGELLHDPHGRDWSQLSELS